MKRKQKGKDKKSKEIMDFLKKGGREEAKEDFQKLLKKAAQPLKK